MIHKIAGLFVNILTVDAKHYLHKRDDLTERIQMQLSKKLFLDFFLILKVISSILNICQIKMTSIADVFPEIPAPKNMVR